jgi:hypothetical protein
MARAAHLAAALLGSFGLAGAAAAQRNLPPRPKADPTIYHPDTITCRPETIEGAFRAHLLPWADQPEEVQQRLRVLQGEMTRSSLRRCVSKGLLTAEEASRVERRLGLTSPSSSLTQARPSPAPSSAPSAPPSGTRP